MTTKLNIKQSLTAGLLAGLTAAVINAVLYIAFHSAGVINDNIYPRPGQPLTVMPVIIASIIPLLIGSLIFFLFEKFTSQGLKIFTIVALVLLLLSLYSPFAVIPGITLGYSLVLCVMHIVPAVALLYYLRRAKTQQQTILN